MKEVAAITDRSKLTGQEIDSVLTRAPVGYLALAGGDRPYIIPLNYLYSGGAIYFHCAPAGRKIDLIRANPRACFQAGETGGLIGSGSPCSHNYRFRSVLVEGVVEEITDQEAKEAVLRELTAKYAGPEAGQGEIPDKKLAAVSVYRITVEQVSGKRDS